MANRFVRTTGGSDGNGGTSVPDGWATVQFAADNIAAGDTLFLCDMGAGEKFTPGAPISIQHTRSDTGTVWTGANSSGVADGTIVEMDHSGSSAGSAVTLEIGFAGPFGSGSDSNYIFQNLRITGAKSSAWRLGNNDGASDFYDAANVTFINCHSDGAASHGFYGPKEENSSNSPYNIFFVNCSSTNSSGGSGYHMEGVGLHYYACWAGGNTLNGFVSKEGAGVLKFQGDNMNVAAATYSHCIASNNTIGFEFFRSMINCVTYSNLTSGCRTSRAYDLNVRGQSGIFPVIN